MLTASSPDPARPSLFSLSRSQADALSAMRDFAAGVFNIECELLEGNDYDTLFSAQATGNFVLSQARAPAVWLNRSAEMVARGGPDGFVVRAQLSGAATGRTGDRLLECHAGDILFIDLHQTFEFRISPDRDGATDVTLWTPRRRMLTSVPDDYVLHGLVVPGGAPAGAMIGGALRLLGEHAAKLTAREMDALADGVVELSAKSIAPLIDEIGGANGRRPQDAFVTIRRYIDKNLRMSSLDVDMLTKTFGVSRASLYRLFEPVGGVASYIRTARLRRAYQDIIASELSRHRIGPIAYQLGFKNLSAFNRLFKETYGVSPSDARKRVRRGVEMSTRAPTARADSLASWLAQICK